MRQPNHIILDFYTNSSEIQNKYWAFAFVDVAKRRPNLTKSKKLTNKKYHLTQQTTFTLSKIINIFSSTSFSKDSGNFTFNTWYNLININFLRKEKLYTKLKYSRSPAYDIVSGGAAALLAGLIGFLISEKFGMEMVDSGDFYYLWMYAVFLSFSVRPLLTVAEADKSLWNVFSLRRVFKFYVLVILNSLKVFK
jgi:hypothetical protein